MLVESQTPKGQNRPKQDPAAATDKPIDPNWAWAPYEPDAQRPWDLRRAGHLYRRAAFGANWEQLQQAISDGPQRTIEKLLRPAADVAAFNQTHDDYEVAGAGSGSADTLRSWWLRRMIQTPHPLLEKMTLFWHGHFATSNAKVKSARLMHQHVQLLRSHALGRFGPLLEGISRDPAMLVWLDAGANRKAQPSEDLSRQLMGRFSLGLGQFSETDVQEAARAFTGWFVLRNRLRFIPREHDPGVKKVFGQKGNFTGEDVVRIMLTQPAAPRFLVRKLYRWLISQTDEPSDDLIGPLAEPFAADYDVGRLVETVLRSNLFFSPIAYRRRIKCPVEFALGIVKGLEGMVSTSRLGADLAGLGQNLYHPPTVKGWEGGRQWINGATILRRSNLAGALLADSGPYNKKLDPVAVAKQYGHSTPESAARFLLDLFLQGDLDTSVVETLLKSAATAAGNPSQQLRQFAHSVVTLPEFQLA